MDDGASSAVPTPAGSEHHLPGRGTTSTDTVHPSQLNRAQTIKKYVPIAADISVYVTFSVVSVLSLELQ